MGMTTNARARPYLWSALALAVVIRIAVIITGPYIIHPDELFQYYEQAHRLAFGSGVVSGDFNDGARSWLLPIILTPIMQVSRLIGNDPIYYINSIRILCAILSLTVVYVGFELARRHDGRFGAVITGILCAIWIDPIFFAPSVLGEVLSAYCILGAILLADTAAERETPIQMALVGVLLGLAVCLRVQMGPALLVFTLLRCGIKWRQCWLPVLIGGATVVVLDFGLLDLLTWGSPFHSVWHYVLRAVIQKLGGGYANEPSSGGLIGYLRLISGAWGALALPLAALVLVGAFRLPLLSIVLATLLATHLAFSNAEYRYIVTAMLAAPILMGMGATFVCNAATRCSPSGHAVLRRLTKGASGAIFLTYSALASCLAGSNGNLFQTLDRGVPEALLVAHRQPELCGLAILGIGWAEGGSYTFLDRDVPLYSGNFSKVVMLNSVGISLPQFIFLRGKPLTLYRDGELWHDVALYNFLIAPSDYEIDGFSPIECFNHGAASANNPKICLFRRPGTCELPLVPSRHTE
jgi:phosphatidylinositol glycan class B